MQRTILLVDDDPADQVMIRRALEACEIESALHVVNDGAEALEYLRLDASNGKRDSSLPDLVLLDLNMPKIDGFEVIRALRADPRSRTLPIVVLTTSNEGRDIAESYQIGANSYIVKPDTLDELCEVVTTLQRYWFGMVELPPAD